MSEPHAFIQGRFGRIGLVEMDTALAVHVHHHVHLIAKAGGADTLFRVRDRACPVTEEAAVLVHSWAPHCWVPPAGGTAEPTLFLTFYLEPDWVRARLGTGAEEAARLFADPCLPLGPAAARLLRDLAALLSDISWLSGIRLPPDGMPAWADGVAGIDDLVAALLAAAIAPRSLRRAPRPPTRRLQDHRIRRAFALLRAGEGDDLDMVAREVGLSRPRFFELFRACTGVTPRTVANAGRMERAIERLSRSADPLGRMAAELGYASQGNFTRFFRQQIGFSPTSYRRAVLRDPGLTGGRLPD